MAYQIEPIRASTLLDLEGRDTSEGSTTSTLPEARRTGLWIRGLDTRFRALWRGGRVIGIGMTDDVEHTASQERVSPHTNVCIVSIWLHVVLGAGAANEPGQQLRR